MGYPAMHLYDLVSNTTTMEMNHHHTIVALSFSCDGSRVVGSSERGHISLWAFSSPCHSSPDTGQKDADGTPEPSRGALHLLAELHPETSGISVERIRFSADERAVITNACFAPITNQAHWPLVAHHAAFPQSGPETTDSHRLPDYFVSDGWIWYRSREEEPRRGCWLPPVYRYQPAEVQYQRDPGGWDAREEWVAFATNEGRLVVVDMSGDSKQTLPRT